MQKKSLKSQTKNTLSKVFIFLLKFLLLSLPVILVFDLEFYFLEKIIAQVSGFILNFLGIENVLFDTFNSLGYASPALYVISKNLILRIDSACTGIRSAYLFFALLFSMPLNLKRQIKYLAAGLAALFIVNIIRIVSAAFIAVFCSSLSIFDNFVWLVSLNVTVLLLIISYAKKYYSLKA